MSVVVLPYSYIRGNTLDAASHNLNMFSITPGEGLLSEPNGGIEGGNLSSSFKITADMVQPEQVTFARAAGQVSTLDNMGDVNLSDQANSVDPIMLNQALPGCGLRVFLPFDAKLVLWDVSFYWHCSRFRFPDQVDGMAEPAEIRTKLCIDGVAQDYTARRYPATLFQNDSNNGAFTVGATSRPRKQAFRTTERAVAQYRDIMHLAGETAAGFHEIFLGFYVQPRAAGSNPLVIDTIRQFSGAGGVAVKKVSLESRLTVGCRNARVLAFL